MFANTPLSNSNAPLWCAVEGDPEDFWTQNFVDFAKYLEVLNENLEAAISTLKF